MSYIIKSDPTTVFIHIPKTAGNAIWKTSKSMYPVEIIKNNRCNRNYHSKLLDFEQSYLDNIENLFIFSFVRNPWSRICSWYFFRKNILEKELQIFNKTGKLPAKKVIDNVDKINKEYNMMCESFDNWLFAYYDTPWDYTWFKISDTQSSWLRSSKLKVNKIIKTENIDQELHNVPAFANVNLPKTNKSKKSISSYQELYTKKSKKFIHNLYEEDIDNFKYTF